LSIEARRYLVTGRVQGVGFRYFTRELAVEQSVTGWVRNLPDGRVEAQAAATLETLQRFRERLAEGPPGARVDRVEEESMESAPDWKSFEITF
jgi:acylphosphatase